MKLVAGFLMLSFLQLRAQGGTEPDSAVRRERHYFNSIRSGMLAGCSTCAIPDRLAFSATTIHGIKVNENWSWGIGTGLSSYSGWQVMPFFLSTAVDLHPKKTTAKNRVFLEFNYGISKAWLGELKDLEYGLVSARGGRVVQPSIGYKVFYHDLRLYFTLGYSNQLVQKNYEYRNQAWVNGKIVELEPHRVEELKVYRRLSLQIGFGWK
jgi:hypothetical protein